MLQQNTKLDFFSLLGPLRNPNIWIHLSILNTKNEYRRTVLGPIWILLSLIIFILSVGSVYSGLFSVEYFNYIIFMATGMVAWNWSAAMLITSGMVYISNSAILLDHSVDKAYLIWSHVMSQFIVFLHQLPLFVIFFLLGDLEVNMNTLYIFPSVIILFMLNVGVASILSIVVTRYRDVNKILTSLVVVIMILTPIFWKPEMVTGLRALSYYLNPFYYIVEIIRDPLLGREPVAFKYLVSSIMAIVSLLVGAIVHKRYSKYVVFWL
jgi:lipopolysaccharide transport system permease protein